MPTTKTTFTPEEAASILMQLDNGTALAHELAKRYECNPSDIWALWNDRKRSRG